LGFSDELSTERAEFVALNAVNLWKISLSMGLLTCPTSCDGEEGCECSCSVDPETLGDDEVYTVLADAQVMKFLVNPSGSSAVLEQELGAVRFVNLAAGENAEAWRAVLRLACRPGLLGTMATDAASNDPVFWPLHLLYDRSLAAMRLAGTLASDWEDDTAACPGANPSDTLPFTSFTSDDDEGEYLTNEELYDFFDPTNDDLPYIYDSF
jgi:hypothetical protein